MFDTDRASDVEAAGGGMLNMFGTDSASDVEEAGTANDVIARYASGVSDVKLQQILDKRNNQSEIVVECILLFVWITAMSLDARE